MRKTLWIIVIFLSLLQIGVSEEIAFTSVVWQWENNAIKKVEGQEVAIPSNHEALMMHVHISFKISESEGKIHSVVLPGHASLKLAGINNLCIVKSKGVESALIRQFIQDGKLVSTLLQSKCMEKEAVLEGIVNVYYLKDHCCEYAECCNIPITSGSSSDTRESRGNCPKCGGSGKVGSWCTFCNNFVSWCVHGGSLQTCNGCGGIGWIETYYQRCPHCSGRGYVGSWCTFCHAFVIWCTHGGRWSNCGTCGSKGHISTNSQTCFHCKGCGYVGTWCTFCHYYVIWCTHGRTWASCGTCGGDGIIDLNYSACSTCGTQGWVGSYCSFCHFTVQWCVHGHSPVTCSKCGGRGCIKN